MRINATPVVLLIGALWVVVTLMGTSGLWFVGLLLSLVTTGATGDELDPRGTETGTETETGTGSALTTPDLRSMLQNERSVCSKKCREVQTDGRPKVLR